jgi:hypothetical protein
MSRSSSTARPLIVRTVAVAPIAVLVALAAWALLSYAISREPGVDVAAYWNAAERLRNGEPLYLGGASNASDLYRYTPWFAYAWVPLTYLPRDVVTAGWVGLMVAAAILSTLPLLRRGPAGLAAWAIFTPLQLGGAAFGNVQPLLVLMLLWGVERRAGPLWIAIGASLKAVPLLLALVYAGRGEWRRAAVATGLSALLAAPTLLFDLSGYSTATGPNQISLAGVSVFLYLPVALAAIAAAFLLARGRYAWLAGSLAMVAALPRLLTYEIGFLLVGTTGVANGSSHLRRCATRR